MRFSLILLCLAGLLGLTVPAHAAPPEEDGYDLWLRYRPVEAPARDAYRSVARSLVVAGEGPALAAAASELLASPRPEALKPVAVP